MNLSRTGHARQCSRGCAALVLAAALALPALAGPGAHGPNGEHLDTPESAGGLTGAAAPPRLEARSDLFELVGTLSGGELSILIDRFETNEPVLEARLEVEAGERQALARFRADHGDYVIDDAAFVQPLSQPGDHALVFTVMAGEDSDLLEGVLSVRAGAQERTAAGAHRHAPGLPVSRTALALAGLGLAGAGWLWWRWRRTGRHHDGEATR